jgi:hypothetical protein
MKPGDTRKWQGYIESSLHSLLSQLYPGYVATYDRYRKTVGPHCSFCRKSAEFMFLAEVKRNKDFLERFKNDNFVGYS